MQKTGLEWFWRIKEEPDLWRRYFRDGLALAQLLVTRRLCWAYLRCQPTKSGDLASSIAVSKQDGTSVLHLEGSWGDEQLGPLRHQFTAASTTAATRQFTLERVSYSMQRLRRPRAAAVRLPGAIGQAIADQRYFAGGSQGIRLLRC